MSRAISVGAGVDGVAFAFQLGSALLFGHPASGVAMFCTGGIRCEKASAFLKGKGFGTVSHLRGGILQYFKDVPSDRSEWKGECFLFDQRWSVTHDEMRSSDVDSQTEVSAPTVNTTSPKL